MKNKNLYSYALAAERSGGLLRGVVALVKNASAACAVTVGLISLIGQLLLLSEKREYIDAAATERNILSLAVIIVLTVTACVLSFLGKHLLEFAPAVIAASVNIVANIGMPTELKQFWLRFGIASVLLIASELICFIDAAVNRARVNAEYRRLSEKLCDRIAKASSDGHVTSAELEAAMNEYRGR